jgi:hypothetical protein
MRHNMGSFDRWVRFIVGAIVVALVFVGPQTQWGWLGIILMASAVVDFCPLYSLFGWSTRHESSSAVVK